MSHSFSAVRWGRIYWAECECGWESRDVRSEEVAVADGSEHVSDAQQADLDA